MTITPEQRQAVLGAGDSPVEIADPESNTSYFLVRADVYRKMQEIVEEEQEKAAWANLARKARNTWAAENLY